MQHRKRYQPAEDIAALAVGLLPWSAVKAKGDRHYTLAVCIISRTFDDEAALLLTITVFNLVYTRRIEYCLPLHTVKPAPMSSTPPSNAPGSSSSSSQEGQRLIVVSNRLPVTIKKGDDGQWSFSMSSGGLVSALSGCKKQMDFTWIGWPGEWHGRRISSIHGIMMIMGKVDVHELGWNIVRLINIRFVS